LLRRLALAAFDRHTQNVSTVTWLGRPILQNPYDAWTIQEIMVDRGVDLVVECGTNRGGSALFMASILDLLGEGRVLTIDTKSAASLTHPRVEFLRGSSTDPTVVDRVHGIVRSLAPREVLVVLDSDHSASHVLEELHAYAHLVRPDGYLIVQDGVIDELPRFRRLRPGPLRAIEAFVREDDRFKIDEARSSKFLYHYSPRGCLRRVR
jgi:cephalosporin hydroxylase